MRLLIHVVLLAGLLGIAVSAPAMSVPPKCNFVDSPSEGITPVRILSENLDGLDGISSAEARAAIISALQRWNQQSESAVKFVFDGMTSDLLPSRARCDKNCPNYNTIRIVDSCQTTGVFFQTCKSIRRQCGTILPNVKYIRWNIDICNNHISPTGIGYEPNRFGVGDLGGGIDLTFLVMHELSHAQGLGHPGAHLYDDKNDPGAYCSGAAATTGNVCGNHRLAGRELYRYDQFCAEEENGILRQRLARLSESNGTFTYSNEAVSEGISNATAWRNWLFTGIDAHEGIERTIRLFGALDTVIDTGTEFDTMRSRKVGSYGRPDTDSVVRLSLNNYDENDDWQQVTTAQWFNPDATYWAPSTWGVDENEIPTTDAIELFNGPINGDGVYGLWSMMSRAYFANYRRIQIASLRDDLPGIHFSASRFPTTLRGLAKPTMACSATSVICALFFVPLDDSLNRIHVQLLTPNTSGDFVPMFGVGPLLVTTGTNVTHSTGSDLVSWMRTEAGKEYVYLAFASSDIGFPAKVIRIQLGGTNGTLMGSWGTVLSGLSVSRYVAPGAVDLVWVSPPP